MKSTLKLLFGSQTRVKILQTFLLSPESEFFVRELTRKLGEQINSVRRELMNLRKIGLLKNRLHNRKKYFFIDKTSLFYPDLQSLFMKSVDPKADITRSIEKLGKIELLLLSGIFVHETKQKGDKVDLVLVGDVPKEDLEKYLDENVSKDVRYAIFDKDNFLYRLEYKDKFIFDLLKSPTNIIALNKLKKQIAKYVELD